MGEKEQEYKVVLRGNIKQNLCHVFSDRGFFPQQKIFF